MIYHLKAVDLGILTASHNKNHQQSDCEALVHNGLKREKQKVQKSQTLYQYKVLYIP